MVPHVECYPLLRDWLLSSTCHGAGYMLVLHVVLVHSRKPRRGILLDPFHPPVVLFYALLLPHAQVSLVIASRFYAEFMNID